MDYGPLAAALDHCLCRRRAGETIEACVADYPAYADDLRHLLGLADNLCQQVQEPPPARLERSAERFFRAAAALREAEARQAAELDAAVAALQTGRTVEQLATAGLVPAESRPLIEFAERLLAEVVTPPASQRALERARQRFLAAAQRGESRTAAEAGQRPGWAARWRAWQAAWRSWSAPRGWSVVPRWAALAAAGLLLVVGANALLAPKVMAAIPGDPLYGWKLVGENVRLAFAFDPAIRARLQAEISQERARELVVASQLGREEEITWHVRLVAVELDDINRRDVGRLVVAPLTTDGLSGPQTIVAWNTDSEFLLGDAASSIDELPPGSELQLRLRIREPLQPHLLIRALLVATGAAQPTATPASETPAPSPENPSATPPGTSATATPLASTATAMPSPSPTAASTASPTATLGGVYPTEREREEPLRLLRGTVRAKNDPLWEIADEGQSGRLVSADVSRLSQADRDRVRPGDWVRLVGRWRGHGTFIAEDLDDYRPWESRCTQHQAVGDVVEFTPGSWLRLSTGQGFRLSRSSAAIAPGVAVGAHVQVTWLDCGSGDIRLLEVKVLGGGAGEKATGTPAPGGPYQGIVNEVLDDTSFRLAADNGDFYTVRYYAHTPIVGAASVIRQGQEVGIYGWLEGSELRAQRIEVYRDVVTASATVPGGTAGAAAATVAPTPVASLPPDGASE